MKKLLSVIMLTVLLPSALALLFNIQSAKASGTIYIKADGSIDPPSAPIARNGSIYTFTNNINDSIVVQRSNIIIDGNGYTLRGPGAGIGIDLSNISNVTIKNIKITSFSEGIGLWFLSKNNTIIHNTITTSTWYGILINGAGGATNNSIIENNIASTNGGSSGGGIGLWYSVNNTVCGNNITANTDHGIWLYHSSNNNISKNTIVANDPYGVGLYSSSSNNSFYHNNFVNNTNQVYNLNDTNTWDDGYPTGGNHWSDYSGADLFRGTYQNITGSDGIGDTGYIIDEVNIDNYPLMGPYGSSTETGSNVTVYPTADVGLTFDSVTQAGSTTVNRTGTGPPPPYGLNLVGQYYNITTTARFSGNVMIRIIYDDSNLTQAQENSLKLWQWQPEECDVTGQTSGVPDGIVNMRDIGYFASRFLTTPTSPNWDPRCDVTGPTPGVPDGTVNMRDIGEAARNFLKTSYWANITTYIDTVSNVIYGEASHLSMFGVTRE